MPRSEQTAELALCAVLAGTAAAAYGAFYAGSAWVVPLAAAAAVPPVCASLAGRRSGWLGALALLAALPLFLASVLVLVPGAGVHGWADAAGVAGRGLASGWDAMLSAGRPADPSRDLLVTPLALTWLASGAAALLALRGDGPLLPTAPPALALVAALALTGDQTRDRTLLAGAFLAAALALALLRANRLVSTALATAARGLGSSDATRLLTPAGRVAFGLPLVVGIAVVSPLVAVALPPARGARFDPRDLRGERLQIDDALSPLVRLKSQLKAEPPAALFRVELGGGATGARPDRMRTAALDHYDGALFTSAGEYRRAGHELAGDPALGGATAPGARIRQRVTVLGLDGPFLPTAGRPVALEGDVAAAGFGFDATTGNLVTDRSRLSGLRYAVVSAVPVPTDAQLAGFHPSTADEPGLAEVASTPSGLPPTLAALARSWTEDAGSRGAELVALRDELRLVRYDDSVDAEPGHSYDALHRVLLGEASEREGYAEQLAAAYVVLARSRGFAARVATGYLLPKPGADGVITVTESDAHAWPEVHVDGLGWVAVEATGDRRRAAAEPEPEDAEVPPGERSDQPNDAARPSPPVPPSIVAPDLPGEAEGGGLGAARAAAYGGVAVGVVALGILCAPAAAKGWRRQRRRRAKSPAARVVGAWRETVDRLIEVGVPVTTAQTPAEVAAGARARFPQRAAAVTQMVPLVAVAVCAPFEPEPAAADRAWDLVGVARADLRRGMGPARRARAAVDPRPLLRRSRGPGAAGGRARADRHSRLPAPPLPPVVAEPAAPVEAAGDAARVPVAVGAPHGEV
jgi:transglutaminase-like putative cysteine protease